MISKDHKTIFVHVPKTGGQSVEHVYLAANGLDWQSRAPLLLMYNPDPSKGPERLAHLYADEYVRCGHVTKDEFESFFKFAVVRHPYDRLISEYRYRKSRLPFWLFLLKPLINEYKDSVRHRVPQSRYLFSKDGQQLVDQIVRFEDIAREMPVIFERTLGEAKPLPHVNKSRHMPKAIRPSRLSRFIMMIIYAEDFRRLGYTP